MADHISRSRGRPRKHDSSSARSDASRLSRGLRKVTVDVPEQFVVQVRRFAAKFRNLSEDNAIRELSMMKTFQWILDEKNGKYMCNYEIEFKNSDGRRFLLILMANLSQKATESALAFEEYEWEVLRSVRHGPGSLDPQPKGGFTTRGVGNGRADTLGSGKIICEAVILAYIRGWEPTIDRAVEPILPTLVMPK